MHIVTRVIHKLTREYKEKLLSPHKVKGEQKIFCIGRNKTGTTSFKKAMEDLGFILGNQRKAELLLREYKNNDFDAIIKYCKSAQVFQDFPFSYPETYKHLDKAYPGSKFVLTIRDSPEQWYNSVTKFHAKKFGEGATPSSSDLKNAEYVWKGWMWECNRLMYSTPEDDVYNKDKLINSYIEYNKSVTEYFKGRETDLLVINLSEKGSYKNLMDFLNINSPYTDFPWENKTEKIAIK